MPSAVACALRWLLVLLLFALVFCLMLSSRLPLLLRACPQTRRTTRTPKMCWVMVQILQLLLRSVA